MGTADMPSLTESGGKGMTTLKHTWLNLNTDADWCSN